MLTAFKAAEDVPGAQLVHAAIDEAPVLAEYVPAPQEAQVELSTAAVAPEYVPVGQRLHEDGLPDA